MSKMDYKTVMSFRLHDQDGGGGPLFVRQESGFNSGQEWQTVAALLESCALATFGVTIERHGGLRWMLPDDHAPKLSAIVDFNAAFASQIWSAGFEQVNLRINLDHLSEESYQADISLEDAHTGIGSDVSSAAVKSGKATGLNPETGMPAAWGPKPKQSAEDDALDAEIEAKLTPQEPPPTMPPPQPARQLSNGIDLVEQIKLIGTRMHNDEIGVEQAIGSLAFLIDGTPGAHFKRAAFESLLCELVYHK